MNRLVKYYNLGLIVIGFLLVSCAAAKPSTGGFYTPTAATQKNAVKLDTQADATVKSKASVGNQASSVKILTTFSGKASWYGPGFHGKKTASGEIFDENGLSAAHRTLPLGSRVKITNLKNGKSVIAKINDRGPFVGNRILDGSKRVAMELGYLEEGITDVQVDVLSTGKSAKVSSKSLKSFANTPSAKISQPSAVNTQIKPPTSTAVSASTKQVNTTPLSLTNKLYVQLGAFAVKNNAKNFANSLSNEFDQFSFDNSFVDGYHKVLIGPFATRSLAEDVKQFLTKKGYPGFIKEIN